MKKTLPLLLLLQALATTSLPDSALARGVGGGSEAGNGGGVAEKNVLFAYGQLPEYLDLCLQTKLCRLDAPQAALLTKIRQALPREAASPTPVVFGSETASPGSFHIDGQVRVARTGNHVGDPIYVNTDLLYTDLGGGHARAVDLPMAASILIHELGHHQGVKDHLALDVLGTRVQTLLMQQTQVNDMWNGLIQLQVVQYNVVRQDEDKRWIDRVDQALMSYQGKIVNLTDRILSASACPGESGAPAFKPLGLRLYNFHMERGVTSGPHGETVHTPVSLWYLLSCKPGEESDHGNIEIGFNFQKYPGVGDFELVADRIEVRQRSCKTDAAVCQ